MRRSPLCLTWPNALLQVEAIAMLMAALPTIALRATCEVEGEDEIIEGDISKCKVSPLSV